MWRAIASLTGLVSFAFLFAQVIALSVLVARGRLEASSLAAIGSILAGQTVEPVKPDEPVVQAPLPSAVEIENARSLNTLELNARADDLRLLKELLTNQAEQLRKDRAEYEKSREQFERQLAEVRARSVDEATEQTQLVVKAMQSDDAIIYLLSLSESDALRVVKGLPERTVAKILEEFAAGTDEEQQRGRFLFEALSAARPESDLADAARTALPKRSGSDAGG